MTYFAVFSCEVVEESTTTGFITVFPYRTQGTKSNNIWQIWSYIPTSSAGQYSSDMHEETDTWVVLWAPCTPRQQSPWHIRFYCDCKTACVG